MQDCHNIKIDNKGFESGERLKYLETTLTNQNSIQEEIKSRLKLGKACCLSVQNLLSSSLLSRNIKIKIQRTVILIQKYKDHDIQNSNSYPKIQRSRYTEL